MVYPYCGRVVSKPRFFDRPECRNCVFQGKQLLLEPMPIQYLAERTILNYSAHSQKKGDAQEASIHWQHKAL